MKIQQTVQLLMLGYKRHLIML